MISLRPYQSDAIDELREGYRSGKLRQLLVLPTGGGKTVIFSFVARSAVERGLRVLVVTHRYEIMDQIRRTLTQVGVAFGTIISGGARNLEHPVQVASIQTLVRKLEALPKFDLIIIDEAQHSAAGSWVKLFAHFNSARYLGVTATPERLDGRGLGDFYHAMVLGPSVSWLMDNGFLSRPLYFAPQRSLDVSGLKKTAGDYDRGQAAGLMDTPTITGDAVAHYKRLCDGQKALVFCVKIEHAKNVASQFYAAGIPAACIDGTLNDAERRKRTDDLQAGAIRVLTSAEILNEGYDCPSVGAAILLRPTASLALHLQQIGRALRPKDGVNECRILDHVGNTLRHGLAEEPRDWTLDGHAKRRRNTSPVVEARQCSQCYAIFAGSACPQCGEARDTQGRTIQQRDGELVLLTGEQMAALRDKRAGRVEEWKCRTLADWQALAKKRGHASGWAWFRWKNSRYHPDRDDRHRTQMQPVLL